MSTLQSHLDSPFSLYSRESNFLKNRAQIGPSAVYELHNTSRTENPGTSISQSSLNELFERSKYLQQCYDGRDQDYTINAGSSYAYPHYHNREASIDDNTLFTGLTHSPVQAPPRTMSSLEFADIALRRSRETLQIAEKYTGLSVTQKIGNLSPTPGTHSYYNFLAPESKSTGQRVAMPISSNSWLDKRPPIPPSLPRGGGGGMASVSASYSATTRAQSATPARNANSSQLYLSKPHSPQSDISLMIDKHGQSTKRILNQDTVSLSKNIKEISFNSIQHIISKYQNEDSSADLHEKTINSARVVSSIEEIVSKYNQQRSQLSNEDQVPKESSFHAPATARVSPVKKSNNSQPKDSYLTHSYSGTKESTFKHSTSVFGSPKATYKYLDTSNRSISTELTPGKAADQIIREAEEVIQKSYIQSKLFELEQLEKGFKLPKQTATDNTWYQGGNTENSLHTTNQELQSSKQIFFADSKVSRNSQNSPSLRRDESYSYKKTPIMLRDSQTYEEGIIQRLTNRQALESDYQINQKDLRYENYQPFEQQLLGGEKQNFNRLRDRKQHHLDLLEESSLQKSQIFHTSQQSQKTEKDSSPLQVSPENSPSKLRLKHLLLHARNIQHNSQDKDTFTPLQLILRTEPQQSSPSSPSSSSLLSLQQKKMFPERESVSANAAAAAAFTLQEDEKSQEQIEIIQQNQDLISSSKEVSGGLIQFARSVQSKYPSIVQSRPQSLSSESIVSPAAEDEQKFQQEKEIDRLKLNIERAADKENEDVNITAVAVPPLTGDLEAMEFASQADAQEQSLQLTVFVPEKDWILEKLTFLQLLGQGKFASVYYGTMAELQEQEVAIKVVRKSDIAKYQIEELIQNEIKIQSFVDHPNILKLYDVYEDEECFYLALELARDGELYHCMNTRQNKKFSELEVSAIMLQLIPALVYLHKLKVVHRDLKPENILIDEGKIKLGDFGCAVQTLQSDEISVCGTLDYVSPEMVMNEPYGCSVDVWSLGILTYELLTGHPPFYRSASKNETYERILYENIDFSTIESEAARDFVQNLLQRNSFYRMPLDLALEHPFIAIAKNHPGDILFWK